MSLSMHHASVAVFKQSLRALSAVLDKAEAHATARKIEPAALLGARLFPDMFPFSRQVQLTCDFAKNCCARLSGVEAPKFEDKEASFAELKERIAATLAFVDGVKADQIDGTHDKDITLKIAGTDMHLKGRDYLTFFALPNFYFHATTAYDLLRHNGVELGKRDFMGIN
ncbi:hypothetical protein SAMN05519103_05266 [Rhizobiales bacterium GAS113]|jgi:hypothetical protein|nr:hypothetical protein SAMN05519103_05266 [Rhizobiales bacterium GAS113]SED99740.1 hypothetical protein SAMN05519104_4945 [Rhizobiales bacterium GAS188]